MQLRYKSLAMIIKEIKSHKNNKENLNYSWVKKEIIAEMREHLEPYATVTHVWDGNKATQRGNFQRYRVYFLKHCVNAFENANL